MTYLLSRWTEIGLRGLQLLAILLLGVIFARILKALTSRLVQISKSHSRTGAMREQQTRTMAGLLYSAGLAAIFAVAVLMALRILAFDITPIELVGGLASVALGFGAQNLIKDLINGFFIVFEDQYGVGDLIQLNGETGRVEYLTLRRTVIRAVSGAMVNVPNSQVGQVSNLSRDWSQTFVDVTVPSDELEKTAGDFREDADWSAALVDGPRVLGVESLTLDGTVLRLQVRTALNRKDDVARELRRRIKLAFEQSRIPMTHTHKLAVHKEVPTPSA